MRAYTRYNNEELFLKTGQLIPIGIKKGHGFNDWRQAATYLEWVIEHGDTLAINIDLDCFVTDWGVICALIQDFKKGGYTHCGIPDAGVLKGRSNLSWVVMNPFFNLFKSDVILDKKESLSWESIRRTGFKREWYYQRPEFVADYEQIMWEPFNGLYNWLYEWGKPLFIEGDLHSDGISTIVKYKGRPFALHSWYSREYHGAHKDRIDKLFMEAKG